MHGKLSSITHDGSGIFKGLEDTIKVTRYHSLTLDPETVPDCLHISARTADGMIMGLYHKEHPVHGVQFHPESIASELGHEMPANFLSLAGFKTNNLSSRARSKVVA